MRLTTYCRDALFCHYHKHDIHMSTIQHFILNCLLESKQVQSVFYDNNVFSANVENMIKL